MEQATAKLTEEVLGSLRGNQRIAAQFQRVYRPLFALAQAKQGVRRVDPPKSTALRGAVQVEIRGENQDHELEVNVTPGGATYVRERGRSVPFAWFEFDPQFLADQLEVMLAQTRRQQLRGKPVSKPQLFPHFGSRHDGTSQRQVYFIYGEKFLAERSGTSETWFRLDT